MPGEDLWLEASRVAIALALAVWIGGTLLAAVTASKLFARIPSRREAGDLFGEILAVLDKAKFVAAGALLVGVLVEVQTHGSALPTRSIVRAVLLFLLIAAHVYAVMVVQPKMRYYREKADDAGAGAASEAWLAKFRREHRKSEAVTKVGLALAVLALVAA